MKIKAVLQDFKYGALLILGELFELKLFSPINFTIRLVYLHFLCPAIKMQILNFSKIPGAEIVFRHSLTSAWGFNGAYSDIDFTFVTDKKISEIEVHRVHEATARVKKSFPMLGEIEIFTQEEFSKLRNLDQEHGALLLFLRDVKKISWMQESISLWESQVTGALQRKYHIRKSKRAIRKSLGRLGEQNVRLSDVTTSGNHKWCRKGFWRKLSEVYGIDGRSAEIAQPEVVFYSREYRVSVGNQRDADLYLPYPYLGWFFALSPLHFDDPQEVKDYVTNWIGRHKAKPNFLKKREAVLEREWIYAKASPRVHSHSAEGSALWAKALSSQLDILL